MLLGLAEPLVDGVDLVVELVEAALVAGGGLADVLVGGGHALVERGEAGVHAYVERVEAVVVAAQVAVQGAQPLVHRAEPAVHGQQPLIDPADPAVEAVEPGVDVGQALVRGLQPAVEPGEPGVEPLQPALGPVEAGVHAAEAGRQALLALAELHREVLVGLVEPGGQALLDAGQAAGELLVGLLEPADKAFVGLQERRGQALVGLVEPDREALVGLLQPGREPLVGLVEPGADALLARLDLTGELVGGAPQLLGDVFRQVAHRDLDPVGTGGQIGHRLVEPGEAAGRGLHAGVEGGQLGGEVGHALGDAVGGVEHRLQLAEGFVHALAHGAEVGPQAGQLGDGGHPGVHVADPRVHLAHPGAHGVHVVAYGLDVLRQALRPHRRLGGDLVQPPAHRLQRAAEPAQLALAHLAQQPLHAFEPLADLVEHGALRALLVDVVLGGTREQVAHPLGYGVMRARLKQGGVVGMVHRKLLRSPTVCRAAVGLVRFI